MTELHSSIVSLVSLAAGIASNHPAMGQCQLARLRQMGVGEDQIAAVIEIARHIRDEAAEKLDAAFEVASRESEPEQVTATGGESCCSTTASGQSCC